MIGGLLSGKSNSKVNNALPLVMLLAELSRRFPYGSTFPRYLSSTKVKNGMELSEFTSLYLFQDILFVKGGLEISLSFASVIVKPSC